MTRAAAFVMMGLTACSGDLFEGGILDGGNRPDAAVPGEDASSPDSSSAACDLSATFGAPAPVTELNSSSDEFDARFTADERIVFFVSTREGSGPDIYTTTRESIHDPFGQPRLLSSLSTPYNEWGTDLSADGLTLFFTSDRPGGMGSDDFYSASRSSRKDDFGPATPVTSLNSSLIEAVPSLTAAGDAIYFSSNRAGNSLSAPLELYRASTGATFATPVAEDALNTPSNNSAPAVSVDETRIYFSSDRLGNDDIWTASRASKTVPWGTPARVSELATPSKEAPTWLSPDGCRLYFQTDRDGGHSHIWVAQR